MSNERSISNAHPQSCKLRIVMIGNMNVGKSSILSQFLDNAIDLNLINTIGIDFKGKSIEVNGRKIQLQLWDTAGQERFMSLTPSYCRKADGVVLTYDVTDLRSFEGTAYWMNKVREHAPSAVQVMLLANKTDLDQQRVVSEGMGAEAARRIGATFFEVSAMTGRNVQAAFMAFSAVILNKRDFFIDGDAVADEPEDTNEPVVIPSPTTHTGRVQCCSAPMSPPLSS